QQCALIPKHLVSCERLGQKRVDRLLGAAKELQRCREPLVWIDRIAHRHYVDTAATLSIVDEPADDRQPVWRSMAQRVMRLGFRRCTRGRPDARRRGNTHLSKFLP